MLAPEVRKQTSPALPRREGRTEAPGVAMAWQHLILDLFARIAHDLEQVLEGLTVEELHQQPGAASNSIGWLAWHLTRSHDRNISELAGQEQPWITAGW